MDSLVRRICSCAEDALLYILDSVLKLSNIDVSTDAGRRLYGSAKQILSNLGIDKDEISIDNASDSKAIFDGTRFNGDGVIPVSASEDDAH